MLPIRGGGEKYSRPSQTFPKGIFLSGADVLGRVREGLLVLILRVTGDALRNFLANDKHKAAHGTAASRLAAISSSQLRQIPKLPLSIRSRAALISRDRKELAIKRFHGEIAFLSVLNSI